MVTYDSRYLRQCAAAISVVLALVTNSMAELHKVSGAPFVENRDMPGNWSKVTGSAVESVLQRLADETKANYERLETWKGSYSVRSFQHLSQEFVASQFGGNLAGSPAQPLRQEFDFTLEFAIEVVQQRSNWSKKTHQMKFFRSGTNEVVAVKNVASPDGNYLATAEHYVEFSPTTKWPGFAMLPDHPEARNKRTAFRRPHEQARSRAADLLDPRMFFGFSPQTRFFQDLELTIAALRGENATSKEDAARRLTVEEASNSSEKWYRLVIELGSPGKSEATYFGTIWSPATGYNPVQSIMSKDASGKQKLSLKQWAWKKVDGVFVPLHYREENWRTDERMPQFFRDVTLESCIVNPVFSPHQFAYSGLGMKDGDLVVDKIEGVVSIIRNGQATKLANFGEQYVPPGESSWMLSKGLRFLLVNIGIVILIAAAIIARRRRKSQIA